MEQWKTDSKSLLHHFAFIVRKRAACFTDPSPALKYKSEHRMDHTFILCVHTYVWCQEQDARFKTQTVYLKCPQQHQWRSTLWFSYYWECRRSPTCALSRQVWHFKHSSELWRGLRHKWDCQCHGLQAIPKPKMRLKIHRVSILILEQSKIPHIKAILMYTVPEVWCLRYKSRGQRTLGPRGGLLRSHYSCDVQYSKLCIVQLFKLTERAKDKGTGKLRNKGSLRNI